MKFIPQRLKNIFSRKSKKKGKPVPPPVPAALEGAGAATAPASQQTAPAIPEKPKPFRKEEDLRFHKQDEGCYLLDMDIKFVTQMKEEPHKGKNLIMVTSKEIDLYLAYINSGPLVSAKALAAIVQETVGKNFGMEDTTVYFRTRPTREQPTPYHLDPADDFTGLPPAGGQFQIVLIPKDCDWRPFTSAPRKTPPGTSPLLRPPGR